MATWPVGIKNGKSRPRGGPKLLGPTGGAEAPVVIRCSARLARLLASNLGEAFVHLGGREVQLRLARKDLALSTGIGPRNVRWPQVPDPNAGSCGTPSRARLFATVA